MPGYSRGGYLLGLAAGIWVVIAGSYLSLFVVSQGRGLAGVLASILSGLVFIRASMLTKRGQANIGGPILIVFGIADLIWSLWLSRLVEAIALIGGTPGLMALIGGVLVYTYERGGN